MEKQNFDISPNNYVQQLADIYQNIKEKKLNDKIKLYINFNENAIKIFKNSKEAKKSDYVELKSKQFKFIFEKFDLKEVDTKIQIRAAKALLFLPLKNKIKEELILSNFPIINEKTVNQLGEKKIETLEKMLERLKSLQRSEQGGNGVFFINCEPLNEDKFFPTGKCLIKFVKENEAERTVLADHFLREMGYATPKSKCLKKESMLGRKFVEQINFNLESIQKDHHSQIEKQTTSKDLNTILVMYRVPGNTLREMNEKEVLNLINDENFLVNLGRMIFLDTLIGNKDRLSNETCNLGNIMVNDEKNLSLIDQEFCLDSKTEKEITSKLQRLLKGENTPDILISLKGALINDRKKYGGIVLEEKNFSKMKTFIEKGMHETAKNLKKELSSEFNVRRIFQFPSYTEQANSICKIIKKL